MATQQTASFSLVSPWDSWSCLDAALFYARTGLPVFPLSGKIPAIPARKGGRGLYDASKNQDLIRHWWREYPHANIGVPTGAQSGWWVIDVDARHNGYEELARLHRDAQVRSALKRKPYTPPDSTLTAYTGGGGLHLVYRHRKDVPFSLGNKARLGGYDGVDVRGDGGYIAVAPSLHPETGRRYTWLFCGDLQFFPGSLPAFPDIYLELATPPAEPAYKDYTAHSWSTTRSTRDLLNEAVAAAQPGTRHDGALRLAGKLKRRGVLLSHAEQLLREYAHRVPQGSQEYEEQDAVNCARWVYDQTA